MIQPHGDRVVIEHVEQNEKTSAGIFLPDTAKEKPQEGVIVAVGDCGRILSSGTILEQKLKVGDRVIYSKYAGNEVKIEGKEYLIVKVEDVLATVPKVPAGV